MSESDAWNTSPLGGLDLERDLCHLDIRVVVFLPGIFPQRLLGQQASLRPSHLCWGLSESDVKTGQVLEGLSHLLQVAQEKLVIKAWTTSFLLSGPPFPHIQRN